VSSGGTTYWNSGSIPLIAPDILGDIIATASDLSIVVSPEGRVLSVLRNPDHRQFSDADGWEGRDIRDCLAADSIEKIGHALAALNAGAPSVPAIELNHVWTRGGEFPIRYSLHRIGSDGTVLAPLSFFGSVRPRLTISEVHGDLPARERVTRHRQVAKALETLHADGIEPFLSPIASHLAASLPGAASASVTARNGGSSPTICVW